MLLWYRLGVLEESKKTSNGRFLCFIFIPSIGRRFAEKSRDQQSIVLSISSLASNACSKERAMNPNTKSSSVAYGIHR